jgi:hypothetical protein
MCAAALKKCLVNMLDLCTWCDYTTTPPTLRILRRPGMVTSSIDLTAGAWVQKIDRLRQRNDLVPTGVVFILLTTVQNPATGKSYLQFTISTAGAATGGPRCVVNTIDLSALENNSQYYTTPLVLGGRNLAEDYYNTLVTPWFDGQITLKQAECDGAYHPGQIVTFAHGRPDWSAEGGIVQLVSEELLTGLTTLRFGPPPIMPGAQFLSQAMMTQFLRTGSLPNVGSTAPTSDGGASAAAAAASLGMGSTTLLLCGGQSVTVVGSPAS